MWRVLRWVMVALWVVAAGAAWWAAPRESTAEQASADIADHRVVAYQFGSGWHDTAPDRWFSVPSVDVKTSDPQAIFAWRTPDHRTHWVRDLHPGLDPAGSGTLISLSTLVNGIGLLFTVVFLGVLWAGPPPLTGTRWYWWWLFALVPFGLGLIWWTFREYPWNREPELPERRRTGFRGFGTAFVVSLGVSVALLLLRRVFGDILFPDLLTP
ncbi:hypothetical protein ACWT_3910 [Actinoplanes sp. SE50]|uniref:hypothetical protein n=1 Tax=unclassified Actinoplanes TaxID=2626549 RepID=UPI00023ED0A4|nr:MULTISPECIES: hypothetical protein [unclassified Actinoplanes]AEV84934.1 hypothetical protein ACPL_4039 [Actinoplanes sp. SE50/110]ATO83325.1 hypothetical protein ACWT_3910 [Actinoplanes sp. SE50]SLM00732.1 uncharacterized protein ACSP50_3965 [Actinoplanes sp. SE50/110]